MGEAEKRFRLAMALGYVLRAKADGWGLFCGRMRFTPYWLWEGLPGFGRVQRALKLAEEASFAADGFLRWLNGLEAGKVAKRELTEVPWTPEKVADATEGMFREQVGWWGG